MGNLSDEGAAVAADWGPAKSPVCDSKPVAVAITSTIAVRLDPHQRMKTRPSCTIKRHHRAQSLRANSSLGRTGRERSRGRRRFDVGGKQVSRLPKVVR